MISKRIIPFMTIIIGRIVCVNVRRLWRVRGTCVAMVHANIVI